MRPDQKTISEFAGSILFSPSLETKLASPGCELVDEPSTRPISPPRFPARVRELSLDPALTPTRQPFPGRAKLSNERARGLVLHFFANHELLALELMALALLKWPNSPAGYRRGILQTMIEEQNHMRLYIDRMKELGVQFGEAPLNGFFWNCMREIETPAEFAATMSMTFEQANIDFALHYERIFASEGDLVSAEIMRRVRVEEIGHVKHGVIWFERWREKSSRLFKEWHDSLRFPITPARAKGLTFDREGRIMAGLPQDYIDELEVHNQSKGRPPRVFWFNPGCEQEIESPDLNWTPPKPIQDLTRDYETLMSFLAHKDDIVMVQKAPSVSFLKSLDELGFEIPEFVEHSRIQILQERKFTSFEPWGWSPAALKYFLPLKSYLVSANHWPEPQSTHASQSIFSKKVAADMRKSMELDDIETLQLTELNQAIPTLERLRHIAPDAMVVFKAPFSASGRGMIRVKDTTFAEKDAGWIRSHLKTGGVILAEPWLNKLVDLSSHIDIAKDGQIRFAGITRFWTDLRGQYRGHILGRPLIDFTPEMIKLWHADDGWQHQLKKTALKIGQEAFRRGYTGPLGIDGFIYQTNETMKLRPMIELNPRWSMGRVALAISQRLVAKQCAIWIHISVNELVRSGYGSFPELVTSLKKIQPDSIKVRGDVKNIFSGVFGLNDPQTAKQSLALLVVGRDLRECYDVLSKGGIHDKQLELRLQTPTSS